MRQERPFALSWPRDYRHHIDLVLPFELPYKDETFERQTPEIRFSFSDRLEGQTVQIRYAFATLSDHVPPERLSAYKRVMSEIYDKATYRISHPWLFREQNVNDDLEPQTPVDAFVPNWLLIILAGVAFGVIFIMAWRLGARSFGPHREHEDLLETHPQLAGIGGWLVLPIIGLFLTLLRNIADLVKQQFSIFDLDIWNAYTVESSEFYHALWLPSILFDVVFVMFIFAFIPVLLVCIFRRLGSVRVMFPVYLLVLVAGTLISYGFAVMLGDAVDAEYMKTAGAESCRVALAGVIWLLYFARSVRVKVTFSR